MVESTPHLLSFLERAVGPNDPYNQFFVAMKAWGRYDVVETPTDADLVLELRFTASLSSCDTYQPLLALAILDTKTHFRLWTLTKAWETPTERLLGIGI